MADNKRSVVDSGTTSNGSKFVLQKDIEDIRTANNTFHNLLSKFKVFPLATSSDNDDILKSMNDKVSAHTYAYIDTMKKQTGDDITRFLNKTFQTSTSITGNAMGIQSAEDLFNNENNNFNAFFFERYKNINNKYEDLRIITEYMYELEEAVTTIRDDIIKADDLVSMISRELSFKSRNNDSSDSRNMAQASIETMENTYKLKEKLKNLIIPGVLTYGNFFVYTIPYKDIFAQFEHRKKLTLNRGVTREHWEDRYFDHPVMESVITPTRTDSGYGHTKVKYSPVIESLTEKYNSIADKGNRKSQADIAEDLQSILEGIDICNDEYTPFMEDGSILAMGDEMIRNQALAAYKKASKPDMKSPFFTQSTNPEAVVDTGEPDKNSVNEYKDISGVFIKLYDPTRVIPIYVMDTCIGYYVLYETFGELKNHILLNNSLNRTNVAFAHAKKKELDDEVISVIADSICNAIDRKYVTANPKFKELIVNAISYQDFYKKKFKIQFIPNTYMTHFKIDEDPETHMGTSVLSKSLFYAKLYLSLLLFKIITILTKSNDQRVYYIRNAGIKKDMVNRIQEIARSIKDKQISFNDLASIQTIFSKVGAYKEAFIPMGKSGEKNIEFDIISGQDVQLNTELMELLRKGSINNSGVPSVILSYMEEADFARTLTMQHTKYMGRIITRQAEIEEPVTEWYKKIMRFDNIVDDSLIEEFKFTFTRPKTLQNQDLSELVSNSEALADFITKMIVDENDAELTAAFKRDLIKTNISPGVFDWVGLEKLKQAVELRLKMEKNEKGIISSEGQ